MAIFTKGWTGSKECSKCKMQFIAASGSQKTCQQCRSCKFCSRSIKYSHNYYCSLSCSAKWHQKNNPNVRTLNENRLNAYKPEIVLKRSLKQKGKPRFATRGEKNPNWRGGNKRQERHTLMGRVEYSNWRTAVFERDLHTCQICLIRGGKLEADHIIPYVVDKSKVFDLNNGRTLCGPCHRKTDTWGHKVHKYLKSKE